MNCKPGDLAVSVDACNTSNIGSIVRVVRSHHNQNSINHAPGDHIWLVNAPHPMTYDRDGKLFHRKKRPVPDSCLRPIRALPLVKTEEHSKEHSHV